MKNLATSLLRKSEKYTKTDMIYLVGQGGWLLVGQGAVFVSSLILAWVFANYVTPSDYGLYKYVLSIATIATITTMTGFGTATARAVSQGHDVNLVKLLRTRMLFGLIGSTGLFVIAFYYLMLGNILLSSLFLVTALFIPFYETLSDYQFVLQGKKDFKTQTYLRIGQRLLLSTIVILTIIFTKNIIIITFVFFAASTISQYLALRYTLNKYPHNQTSAYPHQEIVSYGQRLSIQGIFLTGAAQLDKILLFKFLGPTQLATYVFAIAIPQEINGLLGNINSVAFPKLVDKNSREFKIALLKKIGLFTSLLLFPIGAYMVIAPYLFSWFFPVYMEAVFISQLFVGTIIFIPASLIWHYFYATDHKSALWVGTIAGPVSYLGSIILLAPVFGLTGAVYATYIRGIIDLSTGLYFFLRKF